MEEIVIDIINRIQERKKSEGTSPDHTLKKELDIEIMSRLSQALNNLYSMGIIDRGETINDKWIKLQ